VPYFDSARPVADFRDMPTQADWVAAFNKNSERYLIGADLPDAAELLAEYPTEAAHMWAGIPFDSYVVPTNPFVRDNQNLANLTGRTVITKYSVNMKGSAGFKSTITTGTSVKEFTYNARVLGSLINRIGIVPIETGVHSIPVGRETREFELKISSLKWYPLALIGIEWTGQQFNRTQRQ
jgi:hypothetical protein